VMRIGKRGVINLNWQIFELANMVCSTITTGTMTCRSQANETMVYQLVGPLINIGPLTNSGSDLSIPSQPSSAHVPSLTQHGIAIASAPGLIKQGLRLRLGDAGRVELLKGGESLEVPGGVSATGGTGLILEGEGGGGQYCLQWCVHLKRGLGTVKIELLRSRLPTCSTTTSQRRLLRSVCTCKRGWTRKCVS
jgi:hypothetical protein